MNTSDEAARRHEVVEAFLDGQFAEPEVARESSNGAAGWRADVELQGRIDSHLGRMFHFEAPAEERLLALVAAAQARSPQPAGQVQRQNVSRPAPWWSAGLLAAAAAIGWLAFTNFFRPPAPNEPLFEARPLVDVYRETLANGFEPYYECREPDRFADTFARRQGTPLRLLPLPMGASMLGLSYPGGLSRDTTAMLCRVDGRPVMVFVDRADADQRQAAAGADDSLHVFREQRDGLVFYEVTPLAEPQMIDYMAPVEQSPAAAGAG